MEEIKAAVDKCYGEKALGSDGFTMETIKKGWRFMKGDFQKMMDGLYWHGNMDWKINTTFLTLIPKNRDTARVNDYRPIGLVNGN